MVPGWCGHVPRSIVRPVAPQVSRLLVRHRAALGQPLPRLRPTPRRQQAASCGEGDCVGPAPGVHCELRPCRVVRLDDGRPAATLLASGTGRENRGVPAAAVHRARRAAATTPPGRREAPGAPASARQRAQSARWANARSRSAWDSSPSTRAETRSPRWLMTGLRWLQAAAVRDRRWPLMRLGHAAHDARARHAAVRGGGSRVRPRRPPGAGLAEP